MFYLILAIGLISAFLVVAVNLENASIPVTLSRKYPDSTGVLARYLILTFVIFPCLVFSKLKAGEKLLQRTGMKLLLHAGAFSGKPYLSEILLSALVSIVFLAWVATRRWTRQVTHCSVKQAVAHVGAKP